MKKLRKRKLRKFQLFFWLVLIGCAFARKHQKSSDDEKGNSNAKKNHREKGKNH